MARRRPHSSSPPPPAPKAKAGSPPPAAAPALPPAAAPAPPAPRPSFLMALGLSIVMFTTYLAIMAIPWYLVMTVGHGWAALLALGIILASLPLVKYEPMGFKMGPYVVGAMINLFGVLASMLLSF